MKTPWLFDLYVQFVSIKQWLACIKKADHESYFIFCVYCLDSDLIALYKIVMWGYSGDDKGALLATLP